MRKIIIITLSIISIFYFCAKKEPYTDFFKEKEEFIKLNQIVSDLNFDRIYVNEDKNELKIDSVLINLIQNKMKKLRINEIEKNEFGTYYITGKSGLGKNGYLYTKLPRDSLKYLEILTKIESNWYHWYQD